jgi:uncharacterized membrane protein
MKTSFSNPKTAHFSTYLRTSAHTYWLTLIITLTSLIVVLAVSDVSPLVFAKYFFGAILVLCVPGFAFVNALWPIRSKTESDATIGWLTRAALSFVLSIAIVSIVALALDFVPFGVTLTSLVPALSALTVIFATIACYREYKKLSHP